MKLYQNQVIKKVAFIAINICMLGLLLFNVSAFTMNASAAKAPEFPVNDLNYASNPTYDYSYTENLSVNYTYYESLYLTAGQTVTFETARSKINDYDVDTVMYLFQMPTADASSSWYNDDYTGLYSRLSATVPTTGYYGLLIRGFGGATGHASLYKDDILYKTVIPIAGVTASAYKSKTGMLNFFTTNSNVDTVLWVVDGSNRVMAVNDDGAGGSYYWGLNSRVHTSIASDISFVIVSAYGENETGTTDVYMECDDGDYDSSYFPNLQAIDSIKSENATSAYNCISWSGGITDTWINPDFSLRYGGLSPWYNADNIIAFDNYYGNNPPRYSGATTYVYTPNSSESVIDVWADSYSYTHGSVRRPAHNLPHGYDWESKLGSSQRIFHPREALSGPGYGNIVRYYKPANGLTAASLNQSLATPVFKNEITGTRLITPKKTSLVQYQPDKSMTFKQSVAAGLTSTQNITLSSETLTKLSQMKNAAGSNVADRFQRLYEKWVSAVKGSPELMLSSNSYDYLKIHEYRPLEALLRSEGKGAWGLLLDNYLKEKNIFARTLVEVFVVGYDNDTLTLAGKIRERNNQISRNSLTSTVYIAPTYEDNLMCFINELVNPSTGR
ncbi:MAG TPA: hypothetical protein VHY08_16185 [Bacillota bacterium]|nr:hypothetical protein [Bacillota bacterium]